jgi:hypothetical protein
MDRTPQQTGAIWLFLILITDLNAGDPAAEVTARHDKVCFVLSFFASHERSWT